MKKTILIAILSLISIYCYPQTKKISNKPTKQNTNIKYKSDTIKKVDDIGVTTRILFIFDASNSMNARWQSDKKIVIAKKILSSILDSLENYPNVQLGLRVYGHQKHFPPQDCSDTKLEVPFNFKNGNRIKYKLKNIEPKGTTPIALSLEKCVEDFVPCQNCRNIVILITDGLEECSGDPCKISQELQKRGIILKPFIIGIGESFREAFECMGNYYDASSENELNTSLITVIIQALKTTSCQVNLLDENNKPTETNSSITFYDANRGEEKYFFEHTLNFNNFPDTLYIDDINQCKVKAHTIPPVWSEKTNIVLGKHNIINIKAPQGNLILRVANNNYQYRTIPILVKKANTNEILNVQYFDNNEKYISGEYDIEVICLPRVEFKNVKILQSRPTFIEVPAPGIADVNMTIEGFGSLFVLKNGKYEWIYNLSNNQKRENLLLQPGKYKIVFRSKYSKKTEDTKEVDFTIISNSKININLYQIKK